MSNPSFRKWEKPFTVQKSQAYITGRMQKFRTVGNLYSTCVWQEAGTLLKQLLTRIPKLPVVAGWLRPPRSAPVLGRSNRLL
jgi:hypothetical protein